MESQLASARVLLIAAAVPVAVFLCLRAAGVEVGLPFGGSANAPSSDIQVVADFTAPGTSADDRFDRRAGIRASITLGRATVEPRTTKPGGKNAGSGGGGGGGNNNGGSTDPTPPPPPPGDPLQPVKDAIKPVTDVTDPVVKEVTGTVDNATGSLPPLPDSGLETPPLP